MTVGIKDLRDKGENRLDVLVDWLDELSLVVALVAGYVQKFPNLPVCLDVVKVRDLVQLEWRYQGMTKRLKVSEFDDLAAEWVSGEFLKELLRVNAWVAVTNAEIKLVAKLFELRSAFNSGACASQLYGLSQSATLLPQSFLSAVSTLRS